LPSSDVSQRFQALVVLVVDFLCLRARGAAAEGGDAGQLGSACNAAARHLARGGEAEEIAERRGDVVGVRACRLRGEGPGEAAAAKTSDWLSVVHQLIAAVVIPRPANTSQM